MLHRFLHRVFKRLIDGDKASAPGTTALRNLVAWLFIAVVALFLTQPSGGPSGMSRLPVPWPAELGLWTGGWARNAAAATREYRRAGEGRRPC